MLKETPDLFTVHETERIPENQKILDECRDILSKDCRRVHDFLMSGGCGTVAQMKVDRARMSDLQRPKEKGGPGFKYSFRMVKNEKGTKAKEWFCSEADLVHNKSNEKLLKSILQSLNTVKE